MIIIIISSSSSSNSSSSIMMMSIIPMLMLSMIVIISCSIICTGYMANLPTNIVDFRGFDSGIILILRGGISRTIGIP